MRPYQRAHFSISSIALFYYKFLLVLLQISRGAAQAPFFQQQRQLSAAERQARPTEQRGGAAE
jgi:hypothetical protein